MGTLTAAGDFAQERRELERVLASGIFDRAPNLAHVLSFVCQKYFEGLPEQIKEYTVAVEALGRPLEFDQKRDSIVRVEAHRLRKRLREYYEGDGAGHAVRIEVPPGQYAPRFLHQPPAPRSLSPGAELAQPASVAEELIYPAATVPVTQVIAPAARPAPLPALVATAASRPRNRSGILLAAAAVALCAAAATIWRAPASNSTRSVAASVTGSAANPQEVRILAGMQSGNYVDRYDRGWESDRYFTGGTAFDSRNQPIAGARDFRPYQTRREGAFAYDIPLSPGVYEMRLYFAETLYGENNIAGGGESSRVFNVSSNGTEILRQFDIIGEVGASAADIRAFKDISPAADGKLHLRFEPFTNPAIISAIEITPGTAGRLRPIRMVSREHPYTDRQGRIWEPDRYSLGGQLVVRTEPIANTDDPDLLRGERFGNLRYVIPVPPGRYGVTLYFVEAWFGPGKFAGGGIGSRRFDILCNGVALRRGFDIFKAARGSDTAVTFTAHRLEPDAQGKLTIALAPSRNYACLNAFEIVDESR